MGEGFPNRETSLSEETHLNKKAHGMVNRWTVGQFTARDLETERLIGTSVRKT